MRKTQYLKNKSISTRLRRYMLLISLIAILCVGITSMVSMLFIRKRNMDIMNGQTHQIFTDLMSSRSTLVDSKLAESSRFLTYLANYVHELYLNKDFYPRVPVSTSNAGMSPGELCMQVTFLNESVNREALRDERELLANTQYVFRPSMIQDGCDVVAIYLGLESGQILCYDAFPQYKAYDESGEAVVYDFKDSYWYKLAVEKMAPVYSDVYMDNFGKGLVVTCATPVYDEKDSFCGVLAMDLRIADVYNMVMPTGTGDKVESFMIDSNGIIISPDGMNLSVFDYADLDTSTATRLLNTENELLHSSNGKYYMARIIPSTNWKLCIAMDEKVLSGTVREMDLGIINTIISFVGIFIVIFILITVFSRKYADMITSPIIALGKDVEKMSSGDLSHRAFVGDDDEVGELAKKFNDMAVNLKRRVDDVSALNAEKNRVDAELELASHMQMEMLPREYPAFPGRTDFDIYGAMSPAKEVGGDFYDFFMIDDNHLALVVADVSGRGIAGAMFMMTTRILIKNNALPRVSPAEVLKRTNEQLCENNKANLFVTIWFGILDLRSGVITAVNAGHEYPAFMHEMADFRLIGTENDPPLASVSDIEFNEYEIALSPNDILVLYTDGVTDERGAGKQRYGLDRMLSLLNSNKRSSCEELTRNLMGSVRSFSMDTNHFDDVTLLCLKYYGKNGYERKVRL